MKFLVLAGLVCFFAAAFYNLGSIPVQNDESDLVLKAVGIINAVCTGQFAKLQYFLMIDPYIGTAKAVGMIPFMLLFGKSVEIFRVAWIVYSGCAVFCMYYVLSRWFNEYVGAFCAFLIATQGYFIRGARIGLFRQEIPVLCFFWFSLACLQRYRASKKTWLLVASGVLAGIGIWDKIMFAAYVVGVVAVFLLFGRPLAVLKRIKGDITVWVCGFVGGMLPFIVFNLIHFLITPRYLFGALLSPSHAGRKNSMLLDNLLARLRHYFDLVSSSVFLENMPLAHADRLFGWFFVVCLGVVALWLLGGRQKLFSKRLVGSVIVFYGVVLFLSCFVPKAAHPAHLLVMCPFAELICVLAFCVLFSFFKNRVVVAVSAVCLLSAHMYAQAVVMNDFFAACSKGHGYLCSFDDLHEMSEFLVERKIFKVYTPQWYPAKLAYTSKGQVEVLSVLDMPAKNIGHDPFMHEPDQELLENFFDGCPDEAFYLVLSIPDGENRDCIEDVARVLETRGRSVEKIRFFRHKNTRHGRTLYRVAQSGSGQ